MGFDFTQDQRDFAQTLRSFFDAKYGSDRLRAVVDDGKPYDTGFWRTMVDDLDLPGLSVDETYGGSGGSTVELCILLEEYGRALVSSPLFATVGLALPALTHAGSDDARSTWLPRIASGETTATWALLGPAGGPDLIGTGVQATQVAGEWTLSGSRSWVLDGATADILLTVADTPSGAGLFLVEVDGAEGLTRTACDGLDPTLALAEVTFRATPATLISADEASEGLTRALALANIALAALQLGCLTATLDMAVSHAGTRVQFGRPIGGFQAIKHRCADVFMDTETTRWVVYHAAALASDQDTTAKELDESAHMTSAYAASSSYRAVAHLLQVLGGIGYTWEHSGHLYFKRATAAGRLLGSTTHHLDAISAVINATPSSAPGCRT
ncbi:acyl-CoA dehydrogenase family protein [Streptomyces sp. NPDC097610]|uniref:acyl-CoA dehydrogenase family protein n=1 Tax=Streptomyces sp. NPDC097610 TaxID=3157227 RepID=UPI0033286969